ncbi:MAG: ATP synthase F1 subunit epsilon [Treponema sp.]|nr:ATP synthase F1 subunit epsilon [Treponema sp.]
MAVLFPFEVYTPYRLFFSAPVEVIILTLEDGEMGIYANHAPFKASVAPCLFRIKNKDGEWKTAFVAEGIVEFYNNSAVLICDAAEWSEEIDYQRAVEAKESAEQTLAHGMFRFEKEIAAAALRRANARLLAKEKGNNREGRI